MWNEWLNSIVLNSKDKTIWLMEKPNEMAMLSLIIRDWKRKSGTMVLGGTLSKEICDIDTTTSQWGVYFYDKKFVLKENR